MSRCDEGKSRATLIAAYREGLGLAAIVAIGGAAGIRLLAQASAGENSASVPEVVEMLCWCRRAGDAERVAAAATARLRRRESRDRPVGVAPAQPAPSLHEIHAAVTNAARRLHVVLYSDEDICLKAAAVVARVEEEIDKLQRAGQLKSINRSYRAYRIETSAGGSKVLPYGEWFNKYKANLVRQLAAALRYV